MTDPSFSSEQGHDPEKFQRLLTAAAHEFARVGFAETNVDVIARQAGVAKGTVYLYFENKRSIFLGVLDELQRLLETAELDSRPHGSGGARDGERLRAFIRRQLVLASEQPDVFRCYTSALFGVNRQFQDAALAVFASQVAQVRELMTGDGTTGGQEAHDRAEIIAASILAAALVRGLGERTRTGTALEEEMLLLASITQDGGAR
jgi:AcrR family transcriptional regulator